MNNGKSASKPYERTNERINALLDKHYPDDKVFVVTGPQGRLLIVAGDEEEAQSIYDKRPNKWLKE